MPDQLENKLCNMHQLGYAHLVGNGTSGIYLDLKALGLSGRNIAIPNSVCPNVPLAILFSGNIPLYLDISAKNLGIDVKELRLHQSKIDAVIAVHAYGAVCEIESIARFCSDRAIPLIEDCCVAQGASLGGVPVGQFSDVCVISFGAGKVVDIGRGGAVLTDDPELLQQMVELESAFDEWDGTAAKNISGLGSYHTSLYNKFCDEEFSAVGDKFRLEAVKHEDSFLRKIDRSATDEIESQLDDVESLVANRKFNFDKFCRIFESERSCKIDVFIPPEGSIHWRLNIFIDNRNDVLRALLSKGYKVSSWYPSADYFFTEHGQRVSSTPQSDDFTRRILNLWVNAEIDNQYIKNVSSELIRLCA